MSRIYLDSNILVESIVGKSSARSDAIRELYNIRRDYAEIIIPQIIVGESLSKILQKSDIHNMRDNMTKFCDCINEIVKDKAKHTPPLNQETLQRALEIIDKDYVLDYNDAVLVSHALVDTYSTTLFTFDKGIHNSQLIRDLVNKRKADGNPLNIVEST